MMETLAIGKFYAIVVNLVGSPGKDYTAAVREKLFKQAGSSGQLGKVCFVNRYGR